MKYEQYTELIRQLEKYSDENPRGYEWRVAALSALGYGYFIGLIALFLVIPLLIGGVLFLVPQIWWFFLKFSGKLIFVVALGAVSFIGVIWSLLKSFWMQLPAPEGYELNRGDVPQLFELVEKTCRALKSPFPQHILLVEDFNAAVVTLPKYGLFGKRTFLLVGLPLMQAVSPKQFEAVLAHEIGHVSEKHSSFASWAFRLKETWGRFIESQELEGENLSFLYAKFLNWYFPYFNAYSFVLCRQQEREADQYAVQLVGTKSLGEALINLEIKSRNLSEKFWKDVIDEAAISKNPPQEVFTKMAVAFRESDNPRDLRFLSKAVAINTDYSDSHPSLAERLKTIGYWKNSELPELPESTIETASEKYFGQLETKFSASFNDLWQERIRDQWLQRHDHLIEVQKKIDKLEEKSQNENLTIDELYENASLIAEKNGKRSSFQLLQEILKLDPTHANANFAIGSILLNEDDESGIGFIEQAIKLDRSIRIAGSEVIYRYLRGKGSDTEAKKYVLNIEAEEEELNLASLEREGVLPADSFIAHDLPDDTIDKIRQKICYYHEIKAAYLVKKFVKHYPEVPFYVVFFDTKKQGWFGRGAKLNTEELLSIMAERLTEFGIHYFVVLDKDYETVKSRLDKLENVKFFENSK